MNSLVKNIAGKIESVRSFITSTKMRGHDEPVDVERTMVTVKVRNTENESLEEYLSSGLPTITFMLGEGDVKYNEIKALEPDMFVHIKASRVTCTNNYINVAISDMRILESPMYIEPEIEYRDGGEEKESDKL